MIDDESKKIWDSIYQIDPNKLPSRFKENDICSFQPDITKIRTAFGGEVDDYSGSVHCKIVSIKFDKGKVLYDIAILVDGEFYIVLPFKEIDSCFILPIGIN
jgi:hypothetical protein